MLLAVSVENFHLYGDILPSIYRLRYQAFIKRQSYNVPVYKDMEYDAYDTPAARYLVWRDARNCVRGCTRLSPTDRPYMIKDVWPDIVDKIELPSSSSVWEASRFCIDKSLPPDQRRNIHGALLCAMQQYCILTGIEWMIGVMSHAIWRHVFIKNGWPITYLGSPKLLDGEQAIIAGKMPTSQEILVNLRKAFNIKSDAIFNDIAYQLKDAA